MVLCNHMFDKNLVQEIESFFKGDIETSQESLEKNSTDWSVFRIIPQIVLFPKDSEDIKKLVSWVRQKKESGGYGDLSITVRAAGTDMTGGPLNTSIILDMTRYVSGVLEVKKQDLGMQSGPTGHSYPLVGFARVLPGTYYRDFEKKTLSQNMILPCYPASKNLCAVGGMVGNNGAGEKTLKYGQNKDFVRELKVVLYDGEEYLIKPLTKTQLDVKILEDTFEGRLYKSVWNLIQRNKDDIVKAKPKTTKNSSGYYIWDVWDEEKQVFDMTKLFVGAQGTTGIITEITYSLVPVEQFSHLLVLFANDVTILPNIVRDLLRLDVETLEVYDDHTFKLGLKFFKDFLKDKGFLGALKYGFSFIPELLLMLRGGIPKFVVLVEFASNSLDEIEQEIEEAREMMLNHKLSLRVLKSDHEMQKYWDIRRDSFKLLSDHTKKLRTAPFIDDIVVPVETLPKYIPALTKVLDEYNLLYTIAGHLGNGNLHVIPLMDFNDPKTEQVILELSPKIYELVSEFSGSITAEHNDGLIRTPFIAGMFGQKMYTVFEELKSMFDILYMFNPKKKVGGTVSDIKKNIIKPRQ
jgi:FAD/FMN-containing dehydrogenase